MGGTNPYIKPANVKPPKKKYRITFSNLNRTVEVDPSDTPQATGLPLSILDVALRNGIEIDHACGGVVACSTCHVHVKDGFKTCSEAGEAELDMLDLAPDLKHNSRLACQCVPNGDQDIVVEIPTWNRNLVKEGH